MITARTTNRQWFSLPMDVVWAVMEDYLYLTSLSFGLEIHAFVLMSNHFHLLLSAPLGNLEQALLYFMRETSRELNRLSGRINQTYGGRNYKTLLPNEHAFRNCYKYLYCNPLRAGLCDRVELYPYSTLAGLLGAQRLTIPVKDELHDLEALLEWLNQPAIPTGLKDMKSALRRTVFKLPVDQRTKKASLLETLLL